MNTIFRKIFNSRVAYLVSVALLCLSFNMFPRMMPTIGVPVLVLVLLTKFLNDFNKLRFMINIELIYTIMIVVVYIINIIFFCYLIIIIFSIWHLWTLILPFTVFFLKKRWLYKSFFIYSLISFINISVVLYKIELLVLIPLLLGIAALFFIIDWSFKKTRIHFEKLIPVVVLPLYIGMTAFYFAPERPSSYNIGIRNGVRLIGPTAYGDMHFRSFSWRATSRIIASDQYDHFLFIGDIFEIIRVNFAPPYNKVKLYNAGRNEIVVDDEDHSAYALDDDRKSIIKVNYITLEKIADINILSYNKSVFITIRMTPDRRYIFALDEKSCLHRVVVSDLSVQSLCTGVSHPSFGIDLQKREILLPYNEGIFVADMDRMRVIDTIHFVKNFSPKEISVDSVGRKFLLSDVFKENAWLYDLDTWALLRTVHVGYGCRFQAFDPKHNIFYLLNYGRGDLLLIDPGSGKVLADVGVGRRGRCLFLHPIKGTMRTSTSAGLVEVDPEKILKGLKSNPVAN